MRYVRETRLAAAPEAVFAFHERPDALRLLTPPWEKVTIVQAAPSLHVGSRAILKMWMGPVPITWVAEHVAYDPPHGFADRQVSGPFASWYHRHEFVPDGAGGTLLRDVVDYEPPMGPLGRLLAGPMLAAKLDGMFEYRHRVTREAVEGRG
jgi:ligand-binding SRPBCC domain-containing protein